MRKPKQNNDARSYRQVRWDDEQLFSVGILPRLDPARYNRYARVAMISKPEANATRLPDDGEGLRQAPHSLKVSPGFNACSACAVSADFETSQNIGCKRAS